MEVKIVIKALSNFTASATELKKKTMGTLHLARRLVLEF